MTGPASGQAFLSNLVRFGRTLREAGLPVTASDVADVARALTWVGVDDRRRVFLVTRALLVTRREDLAVFELVFRRFWSPPLERRDPPVARRRRPGSSGSGRFTIVHYMAARAATHSKALDVADRAGSYSDQDLLGTRRFAEMTSEELEAVGRLMAEMRWDVARRSTRRFRSDPRGARIDFRRTLRETGRRGVLPAALPRSRRLERDRPVVLIADVSGSMEKYARLVLQFFHATLQGRDSGEAFVFASRLTRLTPELRIRNVDRAVAEAAREVSDWAGGTRIGACFASFNRLWARRVLRWGAVVVIVSDGCDRGDEGALVREIRFLRRRCHRLVWLNPYAGHPEYEPAAAGVRAAVAEVDDFVPLNDLVSLRDLSRSLARLPRRRRSARGTSSRLPHPGAGRALGGASRGGRPH